MLIQCPSLVITEAAQKFDAATRQGKNIDTSAVVWLVVLAQPCTSASLSATRHNAIDRLQMLFAVLQKTEPMSPESESDQEHILPRHSSR